MKKVSIAVVRRALCAAVLVCIFLWHGPPGALAVDFKIWGDTDISLGFASNTGFTNTGRDNDNFNVRQRVRVWTSAQVSESLKAYLMFRIATATWGQPGRGFALDADNVVIRTRFIFLDWQPESTDLTIRMGIIPVNIPKAAFFSGILDTSAGGISLAYRFNENFTFNAFWARPYDDYGNDANAPGNPRGQNLMDEMDVFFASLAFNHRVADIIPWAMYSHIGKDSSYWNLNVPGGAPGTAGAGTRAWPNGRADDNGNAWWSGIAVTVKVLDPLTLKADFAYGSEKSDTEGNNYNTSGWQAFFAADYKLSWGTPGVFGWYASGSDYDKVTNDQTWGYIPIISPFDIGFNATSFGFGDWAGVNPGSNISWHAAGMWGIGAQIKDISFINKLKHTVRLAYYQGTNDKELAGTGYRSRSGYVDLVPMTKGDHAWEVNFNHEYKIYENFILSVDTGFIDMTRCKEWGPNKNVDTAWEFAANFRYKF